MTPRGSRLWTLGLVALALLFPAGALLAPWMWPSRSRLPAVSRQLDASILLITAGGLDLDSIGPGTNGASRTRNLDRLAEEGVTILGAYAASNQTMASAAALMTGRCPRDLVRQRGDRLAMDAETLAERFAAAGYVTAAVVANPELLDVGLEQGFGTWDARPGAGAQAVVAAGLACVKDVTDRPWLL